MATSAFKSTTKRAEIGGSSSEDSSRRSLRRSRSLSRVSRPIAPEPETEADYNKNVPKGKFVNTTRGSTTPFPEISLDDLALEFFSSSSKNDNESEGGVVERKEREGRSVSRRGEIGRWASDTASSRRKGRSVSRVRGDFVSSSSASGAKNVISSDAGSRRRRSLSVARYQISDSESEVDHSQSLSNRATVKAPISGNSQMLLAPKTTASSNRRMGRSRSHKDLSQLHDGYSSHSSALTDDESKDTHFEKNGFEKIIRAVYAQKKAEHPTEDVANGGLYEAMRKELRYAVEEIRTELNQAMGRNQTALASGDCLRSENSEALQDFSRIREKYATKLEQLEKRKQDLLTEMLLEEQRGQEVSKMVEELPNSRTSAVAEKPSRARKRSSDRSRMSKRLIEEAERYFEDFICNVEDTDISSFDGERSDGSSTLGGKMKERDAAIREAETYKTPAGSTSRPVEMDGVILPWLQWETSHDGSLSGVNKAQTPVTPKALQRDSEKDMVPLHDPSSHSISSHGSWSPGLFHSPPMDKREDACKTRQVGNDCISCFDMDEYLKRRNNEELLFEIYRERNRINSGGLLLCTGGLY
ncbi:hypothetical protein Pfo_020307 [Paulownia fortunei]|nr:hypothetical protein Pfo_020307 [Paulownia fortunei]